MSEQQLTPRQIVHELDRFIVGQDEAKKPWPLPLGTVTGAAGWTVN